MKVSYNNTINATPPHSNITPLGPGEFAADGRVGFELERMATQEKEAQAKRLAERDAVLKTTKKLED
jgi:hypothetical protein